MDRPKLKRAGETEDKALEYININSKFLHVALMTDDDWDDSYSATELKCRKMPMDILKALLDFFDQYSLDSGVILFRLILII